MNHVHPVNPVKNDSSQVTNPKQSELRSASAFKNEAVEIDADSDLELVSR